MLAVLLAFALVFFTVERARADHSWEHEHDESITETTIDVKKGNRIQVTNHNGDIDVDVWSRSAVKIWAEHTSDATIVIKEVDGVRFIEAGWGKGIVPHGIPYVDYHITIPAWIPIGVTGINTDVSVEGSEAQIDVETVNGDIWVEGGSGWVSLSSVNGEVALRGARGRVRVNSVNDDVSLEEIVGTVFGEAVNGDIVMRTITADTIRSTTVRGDVFFQGSIGREGRYWFSTHDGDVMLLVPKNTDATVGFFTYQGDLFTSFPVDIPRFEGRGQKGRRITFQLGEGHAKIDLETFSGDIEIDWLENARSK
jgi:hypothetical protein